MFAKNPIHIDQGSTWELTLTLLDDDVYKSLLIDFIWNLDINHDIKSTFMILINNDLNKADLSTICENILIPHISSAEQLELDNIFKKVQMANIDGTEITIYFKIFKSSTSTKFIKLNVVGEIINAGTIRFEMPAEQTYELINPRNKEFDSIQEGTYTIELKETINNKVTKVMEGDVFVYRTSK